MNSLILWIAIAKQQLNAGKLSRVEYDEIIVRAKRMIGEPLDHGTAPRQ